MMIYLEYEEYRMKFLSAQRTYDEVLTEKEDLFDRTQPQGVSFDKERVGGTSDHNSFDEYLVAVERKQIDERLAEIKNIMDKRYDLLMDKEDELRASQEIMDRLYVLRFLEHQKMQKIARQINYSESHIYRLMNQLLNEVRMMRENENF